MNLENFNVKMKVLLSLPPSLVGQFHDLSGASREDVFVTSDPAGRKVSSGGGTVHLLKEFERSGMSVPGEKRILIHAGGQSRRLPSYAPSGKILTPIPVFDWERGQRLSQNLLDLQLPLYRKILSEAPEGLGTLIASGDVYIRTDSLLKDIPDADVVCYGLWSRPSQATSHGVFVMKRSDPDVLDYMLQKPSVETLETLSRTHIYMMDIGIWLLSDRAVEALSRCATAEDGSVRAYDLYSEFGTALGSHPTSPDPRLEGLTAAIVPLDGGEFYHFGTSHELLSSMVEIQTRELDQEKILHRKIRPNSSVFTLNSEIRTPITVANNNIWVENSCLPATWTLTRDNIVTGVPRNDWTLSLPEGICVDIVPVHGGYAIRPYGYKDTFSGSLEEAFYLGRKLTEWLQARHLPVPEGDTSDIQKMKMFPVVADIADAGKVLSWMIHSFPDGEEIWLRAQKLSAEEISAVADLKALFAQRESNRKANWLALSANYEKSIFYQLDLSDAAVAFEECSLPVPESLPATSASIQRMHNAMFRSRLLSLRGMEEMASEERAKAFSLLREGLLGNVLDHKVRPSIAVCSDQMIWGRSPVRIDVAGGWTDTPPYSLYKGGSVVNLAINLNGQPPLQVYIRPRKEFVIDLRSIDMGARECIRTFEDLEDFRKVGSPFSIAKAALVLAGFSPLLSYEPFTSLEDLLMAFGSGFEMTTVAAIPAGSGLGTSSILAALVLGALNDFCRLGWDKGGICDRTLVLEQMLTTGGGWQDQWGGVLHGVKLLRTEQGFRQRPLVRWLPSDIFTSAESKNCHLLYYTGITRVAKKILGDIVEDMFLNSGASMELLREMAFHASDMADAIQCGDFGRYGRLVGRTWEQNKALDSGTNPPEIERLVSLVSDYCLGLKLPGAGGGGYLYMVAKDPEAAARIRKILTDKALSDKARFVDMDLSLTGLEISRS